MNSIREITGEPLCFEADSDTMGARPYRIELEAFDGNGVCTCQDFLIRKWPQLRKGKRAEDTAFQCKHIKRAMVYFARKMIRQIAAEMKRNSSQAPRHGSGRGSRDARREQEAYG